MAICVSGSHTLFVNRSNLKTAAVMSREKKMRAQYDLKQGKSRNFHELPSGLSMEVIVQKGAEKNTNVEYPPMVFVHVSYYAARCWAEHWLPFFSSSGHDGYAISLLGQGESDSPADSVAGALQKIYTQSLKELSLFALYLLLVIGVISFPSQLLLSRYQELMKESSRMSLFDLRKLNASLPVPSVTNCPFEILVMDAKDDFIVDTEGLVETAKFYDVSPVSVEAVAHDMMLDVSWEKGAKVILSWLKGLEK
ncbi:hypothetical protein JHK86_023619 [Glycine max]|nr:hypothetical protein JHK86_023619 [Glycine max]